MFSTMRSMLESPASLCLAATPCKPLAVAAVDARWLEFGDGLLMAAGALLAIVMLVRWRVAKQRGLAPTRVLPPAEPAGSFPVEVTFLPVVAYLGALLVGYPLLGRVVETLGPAEGEGPSVDLAALLTNNVALLFGGAVCWVVGRRVVAMGGKRFVVHRENLARDAAFGLAGALVAISLCQATLYVTVHVMLFFAPDTAFPEHNVIDALRNPGCPAWLPTVLWIGVAVVTPFAEEVFFRGILQTALLHVLRARWAAIVGAGVFFGIAHGSQPQVVPALVLFGVILGVLYLRTGTLLAPIVAHALFNAKTLLWESLRPG
jgi:hypothetical protein